MNAPISRDPFYFISFSIMAVLCLGGFVPTFFLRSQFFDDPLPVWMHIHGLLLSLWFLIAIAQSWLILNDKPAWHRQLGMAAAAVALSAIGGTCIYLDVLLLSRFLLVNLWCFPQMP